MLGEQARRESGPGVIEDIEKLKQRITELEQASVDLTRQLDEHGEELEAARSANRDMITRLNLGTRRDTRPWLQDPHGPSPQVKAPPVPRWPRRDRLRSGDLRR